MRSRPSRLTARSCTSTPRSGKAVSLSSSTSGRPRAPSSSIRTEQRVRLREKRPIQSAGSRPLNPARFASVALLFDLSSTIFLARNPNLSNSQPFNALLLRSNDTQKVIYTYCTFMLFSPVFANRNPGLRFTRPTVGPISLLPRPPTPLSPFFAGNTRTAGVYSNNSQSGTYYSSPQEIAALSFHSLTNCPLFPREKQPLCFHALTNCPFRKSFVLTFMYRMGGVGGGPQAYLEKSFNCRRLSPRINHLQGAIGEGRLKATVADGGKAFPSLSTLNSRLSTSFRITSHRLSVQKVPHPREHHGQTEPVRRCDHVRVAHRATRLDHGGRPGLGRFLHAVGERKERVRRHHASRERRLRLHHGEFHGIHAAHLPGADAQRCAIFREHDCIGLHVLRYLPREAHRVQL